MRFLGLVILICFTSGCCALPSRYERYDTYITGTPDYIPPKSRLDKVFVEKVCFENKDSNFFAYSGRHVETYPPEEMKKLFDTTLKNVLEKESLVLSNGSCDIKVLIKDAKIHNGGEAPICSWYDYCELQFSIDYIKDEYVFIRKYRVVEKAELINGGVDYDNYYKSLANQIGDDITNFAQNHKF